MMVEHLPLYGLLLRTRAWNCACLPTSNSTSWPLSPSTVSTPPEVTPFVAWTDQPAAEVARTVIQQHWRALADWTPREWTLPLTVWHDGLVVGQQIITGRDFAITREVRTDSWLGRWHYGKRHRHRDNARNADQVRRLFPGYSTCFVVRGRAASRFRRPGLRRGRFDRVHR
ncbi:hypothetical protein [Saccharothrix sp. ALI-22-I]|uniref:hypothetical protein n=1 Tax=Saccharothrix sp. ALI-22-I TaxID=1933778 RepID=UPI001EE6E2B8|nr:hypothetical protein [Saccharothrix sp. ALI-22-I]